MWDILPETYISTYKDLEENVFIYYIYLRLWTLSHMEDMLNYEKHICHLSMFLWLNKIFILRISPLNCQALSQTNLYMLEWFPNEFLWYK